MLTWLKRVFSKSAPVSGIRFNLAGIPLAKLGDYESYLKAGSRKVWAAWHAADITANSVSNTPWTLARAGSTKPVVIPDLSRIFEWPNTEQTFRELVYLAIAHVKFTGSAFWYKAEVTATGDRPRALYPLNPKRMEIVPDTTTGSVQEYIYHSDGPEIHLDPTEVIHFRRPHPNNDFWGLGDLEAGEDLFQEHINRNTWQKQFWKNGAAPSNVMVLDTDAPPDETAWKKLKADYQYEYGGTENSGKTAWLAGHWRKEQLGLTAAEMQNIEASRWNIEQIFMHMGVPLSVAGLKDAANFATADLDNQRFKEYTILPLVLMLQDTINTDLVAGWRQNLKLTFDVSGLINIGKMLLDLMPGFDRGVFSINEIRAMLKMEQDPENDVWNQHFINAGLVPLELAGVADLQQVDQQAQGVVKRFVQQSLKNNTEPKE